MSKELHLSLVIRGVGKYWHWNIINNFGTKDQEVLTTKIYPSFADAAKELNKICANLLPETDVYCGDKFVGPLEMFHDLEDEHSAR